MEVANVLPHRVKGPRVLVGWHGATLEDTPARSRVFSDPDQLCERPDCSSTMTRIPEPGLKSVPEASEDAWGLVIGAHTTAAPWGPAWATGPCRAPRLFSILSIFRRSPEPHPEPRAELQRDQRGHENSWPAVEPRFSRSRKVPSRRRRPGVPERDLSVANGSEGQYAYPTVAQAPGGAKS